MMKTSSSRTEAWIWTEVSRAENLETWHGVRGIPRLKGWIWHEHEHESDRGVIKREDEISPVGDGFR